MPRHPIIREVTVPEAAEHFEVSQQTIRDWIKARAPHSRIPSLGGGEKKIVVNVDEIDRWLKKHPEYGRRVKDEYVPLSELTPYLDKLRGLGHTKKKISEDLGIKMSTLNTYLFPHLYPRMKNAPLSVYLKLKELASKAVPVFHRERKRTKQDVINALKQTGGKRTPAAILLKVQHSTLTDLIDEYQLQSCVKYKPSERITSLMVLEALQKTKGNIKKGAEFLGLHDQNFPDMVKKLKLWPLVEKLRQRRQKQTLIKRADKLEAEQWEELLRAIHNKKARDLATKERRKAKASRLKKEKRARKQQRRAATKLRKYLAKKEKAQWSRLLRAEAKKRKQEEKKLRRKPNKLYNHNMKKSAKKLRRRNPEPNFYRTIIRVIKNKGSKIVLEIPGSTVKRVTIPRSRLKSAMAQKKVSLRAGTRLIGEVTLDQKSAYIRFKNVIVMPKPSQEVKDLFIKRKKKR